MPENILIIEPSTSGLEVLRTAHDMGYNVFVFSADKDERVLPDEYKCYAKHLTIVDTNCIQSLKNELISLHQKHHLSAVIPGFELFVEHTARLAKLIDLPGISLATCECFRNKYKMRNTLKQAGIDSPRNYLVSSIKDINQAGDYVGFPFVIKPIDQSGSIHVSKAENMREMEEAYHSMCNDTWTEMAKGVGTIALVEEYIQGSEYSIEGFVDCRGPQIISITEKLVRGAPYFVEMGHIVEAPLSNKLKDIIYSYIKNIVSTLQMEAGVFHAELKLKNDEPKLIEIAGRLGGDKICDLILLALNVNPYQIMINAHLGHKVDIRKSENNYAGIRYFSLPPEMDTYTEINGIDSVTKLYGYKDFKLLINPKQPVPPLQNFTGRVAYTIFQAPTYAKLRTNLDIAEHLINFT